jgi:hypothetical protein
MSSENLYTTLLTRLKVVHRKQHLTSAAGGLLLVVAAKVVLLLLLLLAETFFRFSIAERTTMAAIFVTVVSAGFGYWVLLPLLKFFEVTEKINFPALALHVGNHFPLIRDTLTNAIQIYTEQPGGVSSALAEAELARVSRLTSDVDFAEAVSTKPLKQSAAIASAAILVALAVFLPFRNDLTQAALRLAAFRTDFTEPPPFELLSESGDIDVAKGEKATVMFRAVSRKNIFPRKLSLKLVNEFGVETADVKLLSDSATFRYDLRNQKENIFYYAESEKIGSRTVVSPKHQITVVDKPKLESFSVTLTPPAYTKLVERHLDDNFGDASTLVGTKVKITARSSKELQTAKIHFTDTTDLVMTPAGKTFTASFVLKKDVTYSFNLIDVSGLASEKSAEYTLKAIADEPPELVVVKPTEKQNDLPQSMALPLAFEIRDDYGFSKFQLCYKVTKSEFAPPDKDFTIVPLPFSNEQLSQTIIFIWDLSKTNITAGDQLEFFAELSDNDAVSGFKTVRSETYTLRLPTLDEIYADVEKGEKKTLDDFKDDLRQSDDLKKTMDDISDDLKQSKKLTYQDKKQMEAALEKQKALTDKLESVQQQLEQMTQKMDENKLVSNETLQKYMELQKMFEELNSPEFKDAMKKLDEALKNLDPKQVRDAMKNLQFNEDQFKKALDRTMEALKKLQADRKFDELIKRLDELQKNQNDLLKQTEQTNPADKKKLDELAKKEESLEKDAKQLDKQIDDLKKKLDDMKSNSAKDAKAETEKAQNAAAKDDFKQDMQDAQESLTKGDTDKAKKKQSSSMPKMANLQAQLKKAKQKMQKQSKEEILMVMRESVRKAIDLSKAQEELKTNVATENYRQSSEQVIERARRQDDIRKGVDALQEDLAKSLTLSPEKNQKLTEDLRKSADQMNQAVDQLENRNSPAALQNGQAAMLSLNTFVDKTLKAMNNMSQQSQGGPGMDSPEDMMDSMNNASQKQQGINGETEQLMQGNGGGMKIDQQARLQQMVAQQQALQKQIEELAKQSQKNGKTSGLMGDLEQIAKEMEEAAKQMQQNDVGRDLINRQQKILSRMLQSTQALRERELDDQRESKTTKNIFKSSPAELKTLDRKTQLQDVLARLKKEGYSDDYQKMIRRYFEALEKQP